MPSPKIPYATVEEACDLLGQHQKDPENLEPNTKYKVTSASGTTREVRLTPGVLNRVKTMLTNAGLGKSIIVENVEKLLSTSRWQSSSRMSNVDYSAKPHKKTISSLGTINVRVASNANRRGGYWKDLSTGDSVVVNYSKDGNSITITKK
jgi:hypothetical protein